MIALFCFSAILWYFCDFTVLDAFLTYFCTVFHVFSVFVNFLLQMVFMFVFLDFSTHYSQFIFVIVEENRLNLNYFFA